MPWVRLDDQMAFNAKVIAAGNIAIGARDRMLAWASAAKSGGTIPAAMAAVIVQSEPLLASMGVVLPPDIAQRTLAWMVTHRVLDEAPGGYRIHDAEEYGNTASVAVGQKRPMSEAEAKQRKAASALGVAARRAKRGSATSEPEPGRPEQPESYRPGSTGPVDFEPARSTGGTGPVNRSDRAIMIASRVPLPSTLSLRGTDPSAEVSPSTAPAPSTPFAAPSEPTDAQTPASAPGCHQDALEAHRTHVEPSGTSGRATEASGASGEAPANCTQDSTLGAWRALGELAGDEVDGIDPRRLVAKLDMAVNAACAWYPRAAEIPRAWLAQRLAGKLASHVADRPASSPDQRLAVLVKSIEYVVGDVRNGRANPLAERQPVAAAKPKPRSQKSFAEMDADRRDSLIFSRLDNLAEELDDET